MFEGETIRSGAPKDENVSDFKVMRSPAGWYIGTTYTNKDKHGTWEEPNSRETDYFATEAEATKALEKFKETGTLDGERTTGYKPGGLVAEPFDI